MEGKALERVKMVGRSPNHLNKRACTQGKKRERRGILSLSKMADLLSKSHQQMAEKWLL